MITRKYMIVFVLTLLLLNPLRSEPIRIDSAEEYYVLDSFFRAMIEEEVFGYVLEEDKPLSFLDVMSPNLTKISSRFFHWHVFAYEARRLWEVLEPEQKDFILLFKSKGITKQFWELLFINRAGLRDVLDENIDLFRYALGPGVGSASLSHIICDSSLPTEELLREDFTLIGILLGYGTYNCLMCARSERLGSKQHGELTPPFPAVVDAPFKNSEVQKQFWPVLLAHSDTHQKRYPGSLIAKSPCFKSDDEELTFIRSHAEKVPKCLLQENPRFVFGAFKQQDSREVSPSESGLKFLSVNESLSQEEVIDNQTFFDRLQESQKKIQHALAQPDFLESVLTKITGEPPVVPKGLDKEKVHLHIGEMPEKALAQLFLSDLDGYGEEYREEFVTAFCKHKSYEDPKIPLRVLPKSFLKLQQAQKNLEMAEAKLTEWKKGKELSEIIEGKVYVEKIRSIKGPKLQGARKALLDYTVEDSLGHTLASGYQTWVAIDETIPVFAHALQGMCEGEECILYVHPEYGYGALTPLPSCVALKIKVKLEKIGTGEPYTPPDLSPLDLCKVRDPIFAERVKESCHLLAASYGKKWGDFLHKSSDICFETVCDFLQEGKVSEEPSNDQIDCINRVFWNLLFEQKK